MSAGVPRSQAVSRISRGRAGVGPRAGWRPARRISAAVAAALAPAATTAVLVHAGDALPAPPLDPRGLALWASGTDPVLAALALVRLVALAVVGVQALAVLLSLLAAAQDDRLVAGLARRLALPPLRRLLDTAFGLGLGLVVTTGPAMAGEVPATAAPTVTMHTLDAEADPGTTTPAGPRTVVTMRLLEPPGGPESPAPPVPTVTMRALPDTPESPVARPVPAPLPSGAPHPDAGAAADAVVPPPMARPEPSAPVAPPAVPGPAPASEPPTGTLGDPATPTPGPAGTWTITPGDHLWHVASRTLAAAGRPTDDASVAAYLSRLIETNRQVLVIPDEPDLVFSGQVFVLPPV